MKKRTKYILKRMLKLFFVISISIFIYQFYISLQTQVSEADMSLENSYEDMNKNSITDILENNFNCVVGISKLKNNGSSVFLMNASEDLGLGTGIIISKRGYILTNEHVSGEESCYVTLPNGRISKAKVIWSDTQTDLAIIKVNETFDYCADIGNSADKRIGEEVYAIGNPIGYEFQRTVTGGIISALNRTIKLQENDDYVYMSNLIQTDATINPGNSGGPLVNSEGKVIGINSVKITSADGIGFAIPINIIKPIIYKLENTGSFKEAYLGIFAYDASVIPYIDSNTKLKSGIYVESIYDDGPAYGTELKVGDIITKIDNVNISKMSDLQEYLYMKNPKDVIDITVNRKGKEKVINIELQQK